MGWGTIVRNPRPTMWFEWMTGVGPALTGPNQSALESDSNRFGTAHRV